VVRRVVVLVALSAVGACSALTSLDDLGPDAAPMDGALDGGVDAPIDAPVYFDGRCSVDAAFGAPTQVFELEDPDGGEFGARLVGTETDVFYTHMGGATLEVLTAHRNDATSPFGNITRVELEAGTFSAYPSVTAGGLDLFVQLVVGPGNYGVFHTSRQTPNGPFSLPVTPAMTDSPGFDGQPYVAPDGTELYWVHGDAGSNVATDIWVGQNSGGTYNGGMLDGGVNAVPGSQRAPVITTDKLTLYYAQHGDDGGVDDIYAAKRASPSDAFGAGAPVSELNSTAADAPTWISSDECVIYLQSDRTGVLRIYRAARPP
jgi:hypothetical protein